MKDNMNAEARIEKLEELTAFQERTIEELSAQVNEQWKIIDRLQTKLDTLTERFLAVEENLLEAPAVTKPPHY
jgi:SlyX protein